MDKDQVYKKAMRQSISHIYKNIDEFLYKNSVQEIDQLLAEINGDFEHYSIEEILTYLTGTIPVKKRAPNRAILCKTARSAWEIERPMEVDGLLMGLE